MDEQPMSYLLFKLNMEMNYQNTFEKDDLVKYFDILSVDIVISIFIIYIDFVHI